ncbi:ATP-binding protein [Pseudonocardia sp. TRM90224]|uniref:ATP-binding protein n=1 Tax=Pseudonocardia sp. TRM90224 TaxID=2812678 RepID=UPI001E38FD44|nr:ATP-binding protein [Pseudonocardia sp. TRM90224]
MTEAAAEPPPVLLITAPAALTTPWLVRERFTAWLTALRWPEPAAADVVFAVSEAVSNAAEHAYTPDALDPVIEINAILEHLPGSDAGAATRTDAGHDQRADDGEEHPAQRLQIEVRDYGLWRPVSPDPGYRGRGLQMMVALMDNVAIQHSDAGHPGTVITLISPSVIPNPRADP